MEILITTQDQDNNSIINNELLENMLNIFKLKYEMVDSSTCRQQILSCMKWASETKWSAPLDKHGKMYALINRVLSYRKDKHMGGDLIEMLLSYAQDKDTGKDDLVEKLSVSQLRELHELLIGQLNVLLEYCADRYAGLCKRQDTM